MVDEHNYWERKNWLQKKINAFNQYERIERRILYREEGEGAKCRRKNKTKRNARPGMTVKRFVLLQSRALSENTRMVNAL